MKVTDKEQPKHSTITLKTTDKKNDKGSFQWWKAKDEKAKAEQLLATASFLKESQGFRYKQAATFSRLYGNMSLFAFAGTTGKMDQSGGLPMDRPTFNVIQSAADTLVSRISQNRPAPVFLTDNSDYKERRLAKQLNNFVQGEYYQTKSYDKAGIMLRDALVTGTGALKVYAGEDNKVKVERRLQTELLTDPNESIYGEPRSLYEIKLVDRSVLLEAFPDFKDEVMKAERAYADNSADSSKTISDMVMVVEGWHLKSGEDATDGRHTVACSAGLLSDDEWDKDRFPFVFLHYSPRLLGFWAQGLAEQLMGTQLEINSLLFTISRAIKLVGVPRVMVEMGSKVNKASFNNDIGTIVEYQGTKPQYEVAQCVPQELYAQLQRLVEYAYQQCGVSALQATSQKPSGLNSGEAIRSYDDISTDRFAALSRRYDNVFIDLAYLVVDTAKDIAEREGKYQTVYPGKDGTKSIDLPKMSLLKDPFVIQCFNMSSLPKDPAGRMQKITEMIQSGMVTIKEGRRLLDYPDLDQVEKLANAAEERIFQALDMIVEDGKYTMPDPFMPLDLAMELTTEYYNLYVPAKLEEDRCQMLRDFHAQIQGLQMAAMPPPPMGAPGAAPLATPEPLPTSPLLPQVPGAGAPAPGP
jgi:hypothetical protein